MISNSKKQTFLRGSLTSSAGIFLSKLIGIIYVSPLTSLATTKNMAYYGAAYTYYNLLLQICTAGLPFAIASIIAKYASKGDYKTVLLVRKLSTALLCVSGFVMAIIFFMIAKPLSIGVLGPKSTSSDLQEMMNSFRLLAIALFLVPFLNSYRGFYQGLKNLRLYANTQVIEQFVRVFSLLFLGYACVKILKLGNVWAVYMAILATSIGAFVALLFYMQYDKRHIGAIYRSARMQETPGENTKDIFQELLFLGIPYLVVSILGNSQTLINTHYFISVATGLGMDYDTATKIYAIIETQCDKLTSIPQVLGAGFSAGIIPYMTISYEQKNFKELRNNIRQSLDTVLFIAVPICFCLLIFARPVFYVFFGNEALDYGQRCVEFVSLLALVSTLTPICISTMMTLKLKKECLVYLFIGFLVKVITFFPLMRLIGYSGSIYSSVLCSMTIIFLTLTKLQNRYEVSYKTTWVRFFKMLLACCFMNGFIFPIQRFFPVVETSRVLALLQLGAYGILALGGYFYFTYMMKLPQAIFHFDMNKLRNRLKGE